MKRFIIGTVVLLAVTSIAFAQSTVSGTLSSGASSNNTSSSSLSGSVGTGNSVTGTVGSGNSLTGTVVSPSTSSGGGGGGTNGPPVSSGGGAGSNNIDICPNLPGVQSTLPVGYALVNGQCVLSSGNGPTVPNTGGTTPGVPNTGAGDLAAETSIILAGLAAIALGATRYLRRV